MQTLYIDPAVATGLASAIAAAAIAIGTAVALIWRKTKKKVAKKLNIDEFGNKETEEEVVLNDEDDDD